MVNNFKYLSIILSHDDDNPEIQAQYRNICARSNTLLRKFTKCHDDIKAKLFKSFCGDIYGISLWCTFSKKVLNTLRVCYNNSLRYLLNLNKFCSASLMYVYYNVKSFPEVMRRNQWNLIQTINTSNSLISACSLPLMRNTKLWKYWRESLYTRNLILNTKLLFYIF